MQIIHTFSIDLSATYVLTHTHNIHITFLHLYNHTLFSMYVHTHTSTHPHTSICTIYMYIPFLHPYRSYILFQKTCKQCVCCRSTGRQRESHEWESHLARSSSNCQKFNRLVSNVCVDTFGSCCLSERDDFLIRDSLFVFLCSCRRALLWMYVCVCVRQRCNLCVLLVCV